MNKRISFAAALLCAVLFACKSDTPTGNNNPPATTSFTLKSGTTYEYVEYQADSLGRADSSVFHFVFGHIEATGLTYAGRTGVAMFVDSVWNRAHDTLALDTSYFIVESGGHRLSQYGFVAAMVRRYAGSALALTLEKHWNMLVAVDTNGTWLTDSTYAVVSGFPVYERTTGKNDNTVSYVLNARSLDAGEGKHTVTISGAFSATTTFTVQALYSAGLLASVESPATSLGPFPVREYRRVLVQYTVAP